MNYFRNNILSRILCLLMAFHIFNISVDMPDAQPQDIPEDLSINDMETVVEIVLEECFNIEDAIVEHDETGNESESLNLIKEFQWRYTKFPEINFNRPITEIDPVNSYNEVFYFQYFKEINPPPPKA